MRHSWLRRLALVGLSVLAAIAIGACGGDDDDGDGGGGADKVSDPVTLTFWHTMNEEETPTLKRLVERFEKANPNFEIKLVTVPFDQAQERYSRAAGAGKAPDVFRAEIAWTPEFAAQGFLADLTDKVGDRDDYLETAFGYNVYQDKVFGIPQVTDALALLYNKRMLEGANVEVPETIDELNDACGQLGKRRGVFLLANPYYTLPWVYGYGGDLVDTEAERITIDDDGAVEGSEAYAELFGADCAFPNEDFANEYDNMQTAFKDGEVAMIVNGPWSTADALSGKAFKDPANFGVAPFPGGAGRPGVPGRRPQLRHLGRHEERRCRISVHLGAELGREPGHPRGGEQPAADAEVRV